MAMWASTRNTPGIPRPARAIVGEAGDGVHILGEQDSVFLSGPLQQSGIRGLRKSRVECTDQVEVRDPQADSAKDVAR